jgi:glycosyltransferase involved in cell wall biosynthesis
MRTFVSAGLRIVLIGSSRFPIRQPFPGGLEAHVWHLARALADRGHQVSLFAAPGSDPGPGCGMLAVRHLALSEAARFDACMPAATFMAEHHAYLSLMLQLARSGAEHFDLIHNHSLHHLPVAMAPMLTIPMLTTLHTPPTPWLESALDVAAGARTRLAAVSRHTAASWQHAADEIAVVPNGIDTRRWPMGPGGPHLVWFGRITPEKGTHKAIAAARRARMPLVLAGPISDPRYFADEVAPRLHGEVRYAGHLSQDELARLVGRSAAALVTPMWDEPYGLVVAEAMACGTPVVAFARGGIPELIAPHAGRLVPPGDAAAMAAAVPDAINLSRGRIRAHASRRCSSTAMVASYLSLYRQMMQDARDGNDDRLLRAPSRLRTSGPGHQHLRADAPSGHIVDQPGGARLASVHRHSETATR